MFDNLTMEIFYYSLIPVAILFLIALLVLLFTRKKENQYKYNYIIKVLLMICLGLVIPLMIGYGIWTFGRYQSKGILTDNLGYIILLSVVIIALIVLLIIICRKLYKSFDRKKSFN